MSATKTETNYQLAQTTTETVPGEEQASGVFRNGNDDDETRKQGHRCCGGCCDVRCAVIVVNLVNMGILLLASVDYLSVLNIYINYILIGVAVICINAIGVAGAILFNKWMVGVAAVAYVLGFGASMYFLSPHLLAYYGCFLYPHVFLIKEIHTGIMTKENYEPVEKQCCCV